MQHTPSSTGKKEKIKRFSHMLAGTIILLHAYERWDHGHSTAWIFLLAGLVFIAVAVAHHRLSARFPMVDVVFFLIESALSFIIAAEYLHAGKKGLPAMYIFAGCMQLVATFIFYQKRKPGH